jgi:sulfoxide reductase heme-binding subunit YedZ
MMAPGLLLALKTAVWAVCLVPFFLGLAKGVGGSLGAQANMAAQFGAWSLKFLIVVLAAGPLARALKAPAIQALRREFGLLAFVYATAHVAAYLAFSGAWRWPVTAVKERPDFIPGTLALLLLIPAAVASFRVVRRRMGERRWRRVQSWTYAVAPLTVLHYAMPTGLDFLEPYLYGLAVAALLGWRAWAHSRPG